MWVLTLNCVFLCAKRYKENQKKKKWKKVLWWWHLKYVYYTLNGMRLWVNDDNNIYLALACTFVLMRSWKCSKPMIVWIIYVQLTGRWAEVKSDDKWKWKTRKMCVCVCVSLWRLCEECKLHYALNSVRCTCLTLNSKGNWHSNILCHLPFNIANTQKIVERSFSRVVVWLMKYACNNCLVQV